MNETKFLLLHYHIFKNAGSTIEHILKNNFGCDHYDLHGPEDNSSVTMSDVKKFVCAHPNAKSVSSHHLRYPVLDFDHYKIIDVVYVRHPVDRLHSMFNYYKKINWMTASPSLRSEKFSDFLMRIFESQPYNSINSQTNFFVNPGDYYFPPSEIDLETALYNVQKVRWLGTVDQFDKSLKVAKYFLNPIFSGIDIEYVPQNVSISTESNVNVERKMHLLKEEFGDVIDLALNFNHLDLLLWKACNQEIDRRYSYCLEAALSS